MLPEILLPPRNIILLVVVAEGVDTTSMMVPHRPVTVDYQKDGVLQMQTATKQIQRT
jgi:hypothetical protein